MLALTICCVPLQFFLPPTDARPMPVGRPTHPGPGGGPLGPVKQQSAERLAQGVEQGVRLGPDPELDAGQGPESGAQGRLLPSALAHPTLHQVAHRARSVHEEVVQVFGGKGLANRLQARQPSFGTLLRSSVDGLLEFVFKVVMQHSLLRFWVSNGAVTATARLRGAAQHARRVCVGLLVAGRRSQAGLAPATARGATCFGSPLSFGHLVPKSLF
uniref:Putative secreted protein n=1 Tax=Ixodes ricinus TaxID=34613 RepID=A0A6B0V3I4_IXORI